MPPFGLSRFGEFSRFGFEGRSGVIFISYHIIPGFALVCFKYWALLKGLQGLFFILFGLLYQIQVYISLFSMVVGFRRV